MKRFFLILLALACLSVPALAEDAAPDAELAALLTAAHPDCAVAAFDQWGDTASAVMSANGRNILCVAEKRNGAWTLAVDNPAALWQGSDIPSLLQDCDTALFWTYRQGSVTTVYSASRLTDAWSPVSVMRRETQDDGGCDETEVLWDSVHGGTLQCRRYRCDENDNVLSRSESTPLPAKWLADIVPLASFDASRIPAFDETEYEYAWQDLLQKAAAELLPDDTFLGGTLGWDGEGVELWLQRPDGTRVLVGCTYDGETPDGWALVTSSPLPEGADYGYENFSSSLCLKGILANIGPHADGGWGVSLVMSDQDGSGFYMGRDWIADSAYRVQRIAFGEHPWSDISAIDWNSLPATLDEALAALDCSGWAAVNNPNPADRLHLRAEPNKDATSLGKYYNGTPARVLAREGDWAHVSIFGVEGWMLTRYLAFDADAKEVKPAFPTVMAANDGAELFEGMSLDERIASLPAGQEMQVLGIVGEKWVHVWISGSERTGYMYQAEVTPGNG